MNAPVHVDHLIKKIQSERTKTSSELYNLEGLARLQDAMATYEGEYKLVWSEELLKEIEGRPEEKVHKTGVPLLDDLIKGFREQQLIICVADSGHGKTQFGLFMVEQFQALNPVAILLEQSAEEILEQRQDNGYSIPKFLTPKAIAAEVTVEWIEERVIEGIAKHNTKFVLIDHLGYIDDMGEGGKFKRENTAYRVGKVMKALKNIAKTWNVVLLLNVHVSQIDESHPPSRKDIKNSSDIIQESDLGLFLWRKNTMKKKVRVYENKTLVSVQKNRRSGRNGNIGLEFNTVTGRYDENNSWVESMEDSAKQQIEVDEAFEGYGDS